MNARDELANVVSSALGDVTGIFDTSEDEDRKLADAILAAGYRRLEPVWADGLENDGVYEYTATSHCDGTHIAKWKRRPKLEAKEEYQPWELCEPEPES